jgi:hypothetical protein
MAFVLLAHQGFLNRNLSDKVRLSLPRLVVPADPLLGSWEKVPYDNGSMRSIYHIREYNVRRLSLVCISLIMTYHFVNKFLRGQTSSPLLIFFSHTIGPSRLSNMALSTNCCAKSHSSETTSIPGDSVHRL